MFVLYVSHGSYYSFWDAFDTLEEAKEAADKLAKRDGVAYYIDEETVEEVVE